jgi:hypothetical protein
MKEHFDFALFALVNNLHLSQDAKIFLGLMTITKQKEILNLLLRLKNDK